MVREFALPDVGEGVAEGEIVEWLVAEGDAVAEDQPVAEVETDKAVVEVPSPVTGTVRKLHYAAGDVVPVGATIVTFDVAGESASGGAAGDAEEANASDATGGTAVTEFADLESAVERVEPAESPAEPAASAEAGAPSRSSAPGGRVFAPPSVRRLARDLGVDLASVSGSGTSGRVTEADVRRADRGRADEDAGAEADPVVAEATGAAGEEPAAEGDAAVDATEGDATSAPRERTLAAPATRKLAADLGVDLNAVPTGETREGEAFVTPERVRAYAEERPTPSAPGTSAGAPASESGEAASEPGESGGAAVGPREETIPYRGVRRTVGETMAASAARAPHVTHHDTTEVSALVETRERLTERVPADVRLTYTPFVLKAVVRALQEYPQLNAELREEEGVIVRKSAYDIGVAVATDAGLLVPVVEGVDEKSLVELAREVSRLASRARERTITREEMTGGTFTVTNYGAIGGEYATPIIDPPQAGILGLGSVEERAVAEDGEVVARPTLPLSLSIDHRVVDGADAARFTNEVMAYLNTPELLLL